MFPDAEAFGDPRPLRQGGTRAAEAIDRLAVRPESLNELGRCLRAAALGDEAIVGAMLSAFEQAGSNGVISVVPAPGVPAERARATAQDGLRLPLKAVVGEEGQEIRRVAVLVALRPLRAEDIRTALTTYPRVADGLVCLGPGLATGAAELARAAARGGIPVIVCAASTGRGRDALVDAAVATGGRSLVADEGGAARAKPLRLGRAGLARVEGRHLVIGQPVGSPSEIERQIAHLRQLLDAATTPAGQEWQSVRIAQLAGGVVTVEVGGWLPAQTERLEALACGAMHTCRGVIAGGYVPGAGVAYLRAAADLPDDPAGRALRWALEEPTRAQLAKTRRNLRATVDALRADETLGLDVGQKQLPTWLTGGPIDAARVARAVITCAVESALRAHAAGHWEGGAGR